MKKILLIGAFSLFLAGCSEGVVPVASPSPTATNTPIPTTMATNTPVPTDTPLPVPTATPVPPLSVQQKIANAIQTDGQTVSICLIVNAATTPRIALTGQAVTITSDISSTPIPFNNDRAEECIFNLEQDAWTSDPSATQVTVHIQALLQDQYGKQSVGDIAWAILKQATARQFVWANLSYTQAWADYDQTWLLPGNA